MRAVRQILRGAGIVFWIVATALFIIVVGSFLIGTPILAISLIASGRVEGLILLTLYLPVLFYIFGMEDSDK